MSLTLFKVSLDSELLCQPYILHCIHLDQEFAGFFQTTNSGKRAKTYRLQCTEKKTYEEVFVGELGTTDKFRMQIASRKIGNICNLTSCVI